MHSSIENIPLNMASEGLDFRRAVSDDVDFIATLVNSAYRGESSRAGWTTEADILDGQRTDAHEISLLIEKNDSLILLCVCNEHIVGSVHLERLDALTTYMGMFVIMPELQGQGLGNLLMNTAENRARAEWGSQRMQIQVILLRKELISYYERRGYRRTGETLPFPVNEPKFGLPKIEGLMFEIFEKILGE